MLKHLYFICPTDFLEGVIENVFKQENYYYTSLGNSITFDKDSVKQLSRLLETKNINEISFVLSDDNNIVLDALGNQGFSRIAGLNNFYGHITKQKKHSELSWQTYDQEFLILSYHLNNKINELRLGLNTIFFNQLKISGKIYNRQQKVFYDIYPDLICWEYFHLN